MVFRRTFIACSIALFGGVCSHPALEGINASVRASGMASTGVAYPQDALSAAYNPAGNVNLCDRFDIGGYGANYDGEIDIRGNGVNIGAASSDNNGTFKSFRRKDFFSCDFGINKNFYMCDIPFAFGFIAYQKNFFHPNYEVPLSILGTSKTEVEFIHYVFAPVIAFKVCNQCFGVAINVNQCHFKANGLERLLFASSEPSDLTNRDGETEYGVGVTFGWQWEALECLTIGLTYQPKTRVQSFEKYQGLLADKGLIETPQSIAGGIAWNYVSNGTLTFDIEHQFWRQVNSFGNDFGSAYEEAVGFPPPNPPSASHRLGRPAGPGFGWHNVTIIRAGVDYAITRAWTVRAGFRHANSPIRNTQSFFNVLTMDTIQNMATVGLTFGFNDCNEISAFYAHGFGDKVIGSKDSIPQPLGGGRTNLHTTLNAFGFSYGRWF